MRNIRACPQNPNIAASHTTSNHVSHCGYDTGHSPPPASPTSASNPPPPPSPHTTDTPAPPASHSGIPPSDRTTDHPSHSPHRVAAAQSAPAAYTDRTASPPCENPIAYTQVQTTTGTYY